MSLVTAEREKTRHPSLLSLFFTILAWI